MSDNVVIKSPANAYIEGSLVRVAEIGGSTVRTQIINTDSADTSSASFTFTTPGGRTVLSRRWMFEFNVRVTTNPSGGAPVPFTALADAPVQDPGFAAMSTLSIELNGVTISAPSPELVRPIAIALMSDEERAGILSTTAISPDRCAEYSNLYSRNASPFAPQGFSLEDSRAQYPFTSGTDGSGNFYRDYSFLSPLRCSPLQADVDAGGMAYIKTGGVNITYNNLNNTIWAHDLVNAATWAGVTVTTPVSPRLHIEYVTMSEDAEPWPRVQEISYERTDLFKNTGTSVAAGTAAQIASGSFNASVVPATLHMYAKRLAKTTDQTSAVLGVTGANLTFGVTPGLLTTKLQNDLYIMSKAAGNQQSFLDWKERQGSVVSVPVASALGLGSMSPGENVGSYTLGVTLDVQSQFADAFVPQLVMAAVTPGIVTISEDQIVLSTGIFKAGGRDMAIMHGEDISAVEHDVGGSLFGKMKSFVGRHTKGIAKAVRVVERVATPLVGAIAPEALPEVTAGLSMARGLTHRAEGLVGGGAVGGGLIGGGPGSTRMMRLMGQR